MDERERDPEVERPPEQENPRTAPPGEAVSGFPEPPGPGDPHPDPDREPHHDLSNPVVDPDPTEYPDPYEDRADPRDPEASDAATPRPGSTSDPRPPRNPDEQRRDRTSSKGASKADN